MIDFRAEAEAIFPYSQSFRRDFHQHPELAFQETRTAGIVARELTDMGMEVSSGVGETGVVGVLEGDTPGPVVLVRFDMDALPIQEETGLTFASDTPGVMHACGHDGHTAVGLSVARILSANRQSLRGAVKFVFQPAEEIAGGAKRMVDDGLLDNPPPDFSLALHLWNSKPIGWTGSSPGPVMSAADAFRVRIAGWGGHGANPHLARDPLVAAAQIISGIQTIVSRNISPLDAAVVSVTHIHGGNTHNVIPAQVEFEGTIRSFLPEVRDEIKNRLEAIVKGVAQAMNCQAEIGYFIQVPAVVNDRRVSAWVSDAITGSLPDLSNQKDYRTMGSEDMSYILDKVPGCYIFVGSANPSEGKDTPHHHPKFDFDERALSQSVAVMLAAIDEIQNRGN